MPQNDRINNTERIQNEVCLDGFLAEFRQALRDEIKEIEKKRTVFYPIERRT